MSDGNSLLNKRIYEFGNFRLNAAERFIESAGRPLPLTPKALEVLIVLVENRGRIVEKEELMQKVWPGTFVEDNNLAFNISVLRKLLGENSASPRYIETVPKRGYRFIAEVVEIPQNGLPAAELPPSLPARRGTLPQPRILWICLLALALAGAAAYWLHRSPKLTNKDSVVLADFVNTTGDPIFDDTLRQGLAVQLEQSPFLSLVSEDRIGRTLRLMDRPADARLTAKLGREVCERTGSAAVLEGSIASLGSKYVLSLRAENCRTGDVLDDEQVQAAGKEDVLNALSRVARNFRSRAGESFAAIEKHNIPLPEATTPSLEALEAYSAGWKLLASSGATAALPLFRRAAEIDSNFAMAHALVGRMYADLDESDLSAASTIRAWQLRNRASDRERFFIDASYDLLATGNVERAQQTCDAWIQTYPRDESPHFMLSGYVNKIRGRYEKALGEAHAAVRFDPDFAVGYCNIAINNAYLNRFPEAEDALRRARARGLEMDEFLMLEYDIAFLTGDHARMERVAARARERSGAESWISNREAFALAYSGRLRQATRMTLRAVDHSRTEQWERAGLWEAGAAVREALFGNLPEARKSAAAALGFSKDREVEYGAALALALSRDVSQAQALARDLEKRFPEDTSVQFSYVPVLRALGALDDRQPSKALDQLEVAAPFELGAPRSSIHALFGALYPIYFRGQAFLALRQGARAVAEFQKILDHGGVVVSDPAAALAHLQLGRAFTIAGEKSKAKSAYQNFLALWKNADPDVPIFRQAKAEYARLQ